jgi:Fur family peroxide stress response transcriptional regulator
VQIKQKEIDRRMDYFNKVCRDSGAKLTHQRMEIFREVAQTGDHPDAETVYRGVRKRMPTVSLDTVYRTLWWLKELGLVSTLGPPRDRARFDANLSSHHHFVCLRCGLTQDFYSDNLDKQKITDSVQSIGYVKTTQVEVKGLCFECAAKEGKPSQTNQQRR